MPEILARNLAALRQICPEAADQIARAAIPIGFSPTTGTDGTPTYARFVNESTPAGTADGATARRIEWLGGTSMPRASAEPIIKNLDAASAGASGLALSIGTGCEWAAFVRKLAPAQLLYVFEPDPALLRMALDICDVAEPLSTRRLVILPPTATAAAESLARFLAENPGFEPPTVLHPPPTLTASRKRELLTAGESIVRRAVSSRQERLSAAREKILALLAAHPGLRPAHTLAFLLTPRYPVERPIAAAAHAADAKIIWIDRHDSASPLLRLESLATELYLAAESGAPGQPAGPILSDLFREQLATIPPGIPIETWIPPMVGPGFWEKIPPPATLAAEDRIIVHAGAQAQLLESRGFPTEKILIRPLRPSVLRAAQPTAAFALRHRVALIADLPCLHAAALGIQLPTHVAVFSAARELIAADELAVHPGMARDMLRRAMLRAGVDPATPDPALAEPMLRIIRDVLIPHLPPVALARRLADAQIPLLLLGDWSGSADELKVDGVRVAITDFASYSAQSWRQTAVLAHLSPTGALWPFVGEAVDAGVTIAAPQHPSDAQPGSLAQVLKPGEDFAHPSPAQFIQTLKQLLRDAPRREKFCAAARHSASSATGDARPDGRR